jgi:hypothetical protein
MKLTQLAAKPQLVKITIDDKETIAEYGEAVEFWVWDRQPIERFIQMATIKQDDFGSLVETVNGMVLDEDGKPICNDGVTLPAGIMTRVINKVVETLGK